MIIWISTVGWSPFAVINPLWAYCKEKGDAPHRIILIYTNYEKIKKNLEICKNYIDHLLNSYVIGSKRDFEIITYPIESDNLINYANILKKIIQEQKQSNPDKIILDMTPGRKFMSALTVYYGCQNSEVPIKVFYLHLSDRTYQDVPYPLTPIIKSELIDILDSSEVFSSNFESTKIKIENDNTLDLLLNAKECSEDLDLTKDLFVLYAIKIDFDSKTKIRRYLGENGIYLFGAELNKILKKLTLLDQIRLENEMNNNQNYNSYTITEIGTQKLKDIKNKLKI